MFPATTVPSPTFTSCSHLNPIDPAQYPADGRLGLEEPSTAATSWRRSVHPLTGALDDYDPLLERIGDARFVLIGEASHGTHEFYRERAVITQAADPREGVHRRRRRGRLARRLSRQSLRPRAAATTPRPSTRSAGFRRFPTWMWRNADVLDFVGWLRTHNDDAPAGRRKVGFYGLDLYSLHASMEAVLAYLDKVDPEAAAPRPPPLRLLRPLRRRHAGLRLRRRASACARPASTRSITQLVELHRQRGRVRAAATAGSPRTTTSTPSRTRGWCGTPSSTTATMFRGEVVVLEPARPAHGRDARRAASTSSSAAAGREGRRLGAQLAPRRRPGDGDGRARRVERRPARARAVTAATPCSSASRPTTAR